MSTTLAAPGPEPDAPPRGRKRSALCVLLVCLAYAGVLCWLDAGRGLFARLGELALPLLLCTVPVLASYLVRYARWAWLLRRRGHAVPWRPGLSAYLSGFALTATPGKAGELLRVRYFARQGVPPERTLAVFVFERASDLAVILLLSLLAAPVFPALGVLAALVLAVLVLVFGAAAWAPARHALARLGARLPGRALPHLVAFAARAITELGHCLDARSLLRSLGAGLLAWGLTSAVFVLICHAMGLTLPAGVIWGIYPLAMLIGALSFVPGGVGTTELGIVLMLQPLGVSATDAMVVAIGVRLVTLWLAMAVGLVAVLGLELRQRR